MHKQTTKSQQINSYMQMVIDYDQILKTNDDILYALQKALGNDVKKIKFKNTKTVFKYTNKDNNIEHYFLVASISYLGSPHPTFKKRMQLKKWYKDFYDEFKEEKNTKIHLLGIYHYDNMEIFCEFQIKDYIDKKMNSSSAHVFINDLFQAVKYNIFTKQDHKGNNLTTIKGIYLKSYLSKSLSKWNNEIINHFEKFNQEFQFDNWLMADQCISKMLDNHWYQSKQPEWPGFWLEYNFDKFIKNNHIEDDIKYIPSGDFDIHFKKLDFFGDLKASDIIKKIAPANDIENTIKYISQFGKIWYILYEHDTIKDINMKSQMAIRRMKLLNTWSESKKISYAHRLKHSVKFKKMYIFELNAINMHEIMSVFNQGHNSNNSKRKPKFAINKKNINNYIIYSYSKGNNEKEI
ncbi:hypothetical protein MCANUFG1_00633 [Mycoplasmopsis canis UFG1]|uniref:hypothetical protein n=1 Tax=Mycoplasmopsis canis TaxID=29555 RepID=UPI00025B0B53|nr:hypothetical protein [Mycoplasmopsis canis]EIE42099.1 hypothetical protein MCANUFG1_00633 [Mycoplasmopsis canis UFG1]